MRVGDAGAAESLRKCVTCLRSQARHGGQAIKLRIVARTRDGADVDETLDAVSFEEREEIFE